LTRRVGRRSPFRRRPSRTLASQMLWCCRSVLGLGVMTFRCLHGDGRILGREANPRKCTCPSRSRTNSQPRKWTTQLVRCAPRRSCCQSSMARQMCALPSPPSTIQVDQALMGLLLRAPVCRARICQTAVLLSRLHRLFVGQARFRTVQIGAFSILALGWMASIGIYGVMELPGDPADARVRHPSQCRATQGDVLRLVLGGRRC